MVGATDPLQEGRDRTRRAELAHQLDITDIDAEFKRSGSHQRAQRSALEPPFGIEALLFRKTAMMGGNTVLADALA